jgi:predicted Fe-S protein YdhL (DUF1289 family)
MAGIHLSDIEAAINWWRAGGGSGSPAPSLPGAELPAPLAALAELYARMVYFRHSECDEAQMGDAAHAAWLAWYATTPDAPCIAICSTTQGDAVCKGCGRTFDEVQHWPQFSPADKRRVWRRITADGSAWRFNRYAERARLSGSAA